MRLNERFIVEKANVTCAEVIDLARGVAAPINITREHVGEELTEIERQDREGEHIVLPDGEGDAVFVPTELVAGLCFALGYLHVEADQERFGNDEKEAA